MLTLKTLNSEGFDDPLSFNGISRGLSLTGKPSCVLVRYLGCEELASPRDLDDRCGGELVCSKTEDGHRKVYAI